jgi:glycosyltransferase involved in cell wall biosynthesis
VIEPPGNQVDASVIVGSVNGGEWIHLLLAALEAQETKYRFQVIVADRTTDGTRAQIAAHHPNVQLLCESAGSTLPELRTRAFEHARGRYVFVTEDHTVPPSNWIERFCSALDAAPLEVAAVGGPVDNGLVSGAVNWAAFLCEYSGYLPPLESADVSDVPGMNIAYRRDVFDGIERDVLTRGFWESSLHPHLLARGRRFRRLADVVMVHRKHFGFRYFLSQRYHYSRYYAGARFSRDDQRRYLFGALSVLLPPLVVTRVARNALKRPKYARSAVQSMPALSCFALAWGVGECVGYLFGPGDSLVEIE